MKITTPGIYPDFPIDAYFADPCPEPSLSQSTAKLILERSAGHAMYDHPRFARVRPDDDEEKYTKAKAIGNAAHKLILGRGKDIEVFDFKDWRTKAAQEARDECMYAGRLPILSKHMEQAYAIHQFFAANMKAHEVKLTEAFKSEVVIAWQEGGFWFRSMIDMLGDDMLQMVDLKTISTCSGPNEAGAKMAGDGWDIQCACIDRGLNVLHPESAGRRKYHFISIEQDPPFGLVVNELRESVLTIGRAKLDRAVSTWQKCLTSGVWPAYPLKVNYPEHPEWHVKQWEQRNFQAILEQTT